LQVEEDFYTAADGTLRAYDADNDRTPMVDEKVEAKATLVRLALANYHGADHDAIQDECTKRLREGSFTEAYADQVLLRIKGRPQPGSIEDVEAMPA
jgi:hypothetical protein